MTAPMNHTPDPDPDPLTTPGVSSHGVEPGETPPDAGQMSGAAGDSRRGDAPNMGPVSGNRTPMFFALAILALLVLSVAAFTVASLFAS